MAYRFDDNGDLVIDGFEKGIASSPYNGIANIRNLSTTYYPGVAYVNYRRQAATFGSVSGAVWFAGNNSTDVSNNTGWSFSSGTMSNPVQEATSPAGLHYILDDSGQIFKQSAVNSSTFTILGNGTGRTGQGAGGLAYWNNYLVVFGDGMIEFCGDGTGDAGIIATNWNVAGTPSQVDVVSQITSSGVDFTSGPTTGATSATLASVWSGVSGAYFVRFTQGGTPDERTVTFTNGSANVSWTGGLSADATVQFLMYKLFCTNSTFVGTNLFLDTYQVTFTSTGTLPTGISAGTTYYLLSTPVLTGGTAFTISTTEAGTFLPLTNAGTGTITMHLLPSTHPPIINTTLAYSTGYSWGTSGIGSTTLTLVNYWLGSSGTYNLVDTAGNNFLGVFTYQSDTVTLVNSARIQILGTLSVQIVNPSATSYRTWVSKVDGNLYFANGRWVGRISTAPNITLKFNPGLPASFTVNYSATGTLQLNDSVVDMTDLHGTMVIAGNRDIYPWDYVSAQPSASSPVGEQIYRLKNILNNVYILAGQKGNIYITNGFSAQFFTKIPDFVAGIIDPVWSWGSIMVHRSKLFFQALAKNTSGTNILAGIFSLIVSSSADQEVKGLVMEAQNSYGLTPASGALQNGILIDNDPSANGNDSYYSAWSNGATTGGIDYNDTSGWQNWEPLIETDIIPIGNILNKKTFGQIEFKLDRPMVSGDQIRMYSRPSLTDSYTLMGTTTSAQLSDYYNSNISQSQWAQFKVEMKCASSGSSFIPLREIRIHKPK